jgi:hygromycin-B 7''-O-kinase
MSTLVAVATLSQLKARQALNSVGLPAPTLELASSVTNEVWLTPTHVIRFNRSGDGRLRREAFLSRFLPPQLRYPTVVAYGGDVGADYLILERLPGRPLARCWSEMSDASRELAVRQIARGLRHLHETPTPPGLPPIEAPQLIDPQARRPVALLERSIEKATRLDNVDTNLIGDVAAFVKEHAEALEPMSSATLVHGDLTFENVLWDGTRITILDYEWAHGAPRDVDLDILLRCCALPNLHVAADYESRVHARDYRQVPGWLAREYPALFEAPRIGERLVLYSIAFDVRELLAFPPRMTARYLSPFHPINRLRHTLSGNSYIAHFAATLTR